MRFVLIFGPSAVGKMTVGQALAEKTGMKLYHNHMSIEAVQPIFDFGTPQFNRLVSLYRLEMMREAAQSDLPGLIFTFVWALDLPSEHEHVAEMTDIFKAVGAEICYVELEASLDTRLERNKHELRLLAKPTKRDIVTSEKVLHYESKYQLNTTDGAFPYPNHLKIQNDELSAEEVANLIVEGFKFDVQS